MTLQNCLSVKKTKTKTHKKIQNTWKVQKRIFHVFMKANTHVSKHINKQLYKYTNKQISFLHMYMKCGVCERFWAALTINIRSISQKNKILFF